MKLILFLSLFITSLLSFQIQPRAETFNIKILNKINMLNEEEKNSSDASTKDRLKLEKIELINYFLEKLDRGDFAALSQNNREELFVQNLKKLKKAHDKSDRLEILIVQMQISIILMERSFETFLVTVNEYNNSLKPIDDYKNIFIKYSESMIFSDKVYKISYS
nr:hypothetical protein [Sulfurimonas sp.]